MKVNKMFEDDPIDNVTVDVPLFIRLLEYAKEDAKTDMDLHNVAQKAISLTKERGILAMEDYEELVGGTTPPINLKEMIRKSLMKFNK